MDDAAERGHRRVDARQDVCHLSTIGDIGREYAHVRTSVTHRRDRVLGVFRCAAPADERNVTNAAFNHPLRNRQTDPAEATGDYVCRAGTQGR
jgi:hypothetical protein